MEGNELTVMSGTALSVPPATVIAEAKIAVNVFKGVIELKPKKVIINNEQYLEYEDWQTLGEFYRCSVVTRDAVPIEIDGVKGAKAKADLVNIDTGVIIGGAEAYCMRDEEKWSTRPKYEWQGEGDNRKRIKVGDEVVPWFQLASMSQTRAAAKAFRNRLAWVAVLAGYRPTPAEEMTESTVSSAVQERRTVDKSEHYCAEHNVNFFKSGKMRGYAHPIEGTKEWCNEPEEPVKKPVTRGEFAKAGIDILEESIKEAQKHPGPPSESPESVTEPLDEETKADVQTGVMSPPELDFDPDILMEDLKKVRWSNNTVKSYIKNIYKVDTEGTVVEVVSRLTKEQRKAFLGEVQERLTMA